MANPKHVAKLRKGVEAWNAWRRENTGIIVDLSKADLHEADLRGARIQNANLNEADLRGAKLRKAQLHAANLRKAQLGGANLFGADLRGAHLSEAELCGSDLRAADLSGADLTWADLTEASLTEANLSWANLGGADLKRSHLVTVSFKSTKLDNTNMADAAIGSTIFASTDLSTVRGLDTIQHHGPSLIDIQTILLSGGKIPEAFLRGAGVPETFIINMKPIVGVQAVEFYSCFISYSTKDQAFADRLYADLQNKGVRCWFAPHDVQAGRKLHEQIDEAIRLHDKLLLILSPHSMESEWVMTEIAKAHRREVRDKRRVLFPIRLAPFEALRDWECFDADTGKDSAREIREYFIPDFSNWKNHDSYQDAFQRLISDLKASDSKVK
jgi:uncharacterized protein YjbI with pentapeptide repeats